MKKVISITLNGVIFMIEEDALQKLSSYLDSIKAHYGTDGKEIVNDIEANIADKFKAKNGGSERAVTIAEVEEIIGVMGTVDQMEENESADPEKNDRTKEEGTENRKVKRLYRDSNNAILGGVCTGLAAYFSVDVVIIRLIFVALAIMNGVGILIYIIMWLIVPLAKTSVQKLEMQGEPINLKNIEEVVKEKSEMIKEQGKKAFVSLKDQKSTFYRILTLPIVLIEAMIRFLRGIWDIILPVARIGVGLLMLFGVFVSFVFASFWASILLFKTDSPFVQTDFPIELIANSKAYFVTVTSGYFSVLIFIIVGLLLAISVLSKKMILNWTISIILFALLALNVTVTSVYGFDLASNIKSVYDKYITENTVERTIDAKGFDSISGDISGRIRIEKSPIYEVTARGLKNDVDNIEFIVDATSSDGHVELKIVDNAHRNRHGAFVISKDVEIVIKMPELKRLQADNIHDYELSGFSDDAVVRSENERDRRNRPERRLGDDRDENGCIASAGYGWCESSGKCIRPWEEVCEADINFIATGTAVKLLGGNNGEDLYLDYEDDDSVMQRAQLLFDAESLCGDEERKIVCVALSVSDYGLTSGKKVKIRGIESEGIVTVREVVKIEK